jgi:hypothetical protein
MLHIRLLLILRNSRALGCSFLSLPVIVARANLLVAISARRNTQALGAALEAEEHAWLLM